MRYDDYDDAPYGRRLRPGGASTGSYLLALLIGFTIGAFLLWVGSRWLMPAKPPLTDPMVEERPSVPRGPLDAEETEANRIFREVKGSVVNVDTVLRRRNWDRRVLEQQTGTGSGLVWDKQGRIVTNFHVIQNAGQQGGGIRVVMPDRKEYDASIVGVAPDYDLAVIQIAAPKEEFQPIKVGRSEDLAVGQKVFAIGNPFGLSHTLTKGIISAVDRTIESPTGVPILHAIQTDAAINPGNSGGPLLDKEGRLIGVNQSITTPSGGNVGIGFAIPVDTVNAKVTELIQRGRVLTPDLGVKLYDEATLRREGPRWAKGVMVESVTPNGPAAQANLRGIQIDPKTGNGTAGDLIVGINGQPVNSIADYKRLTKTLTIGEPATIRFRRGDDEIEEQVMVQGV